MHPDDFFCPFLFEHLDIRGALVRLGPAWRSMHAGRGYPAPVLALLGEMAAVSVLIGANLKQVGRLTFQLKGNGPVGMLVLDCDEQLRLRGMARCAAEIAEAPVPELLGDGQLLLSLDAVGLAQPYQSLVPIDGDSIAGIFEHYLLRSEQQPSRLFLVADAQGAAGLFLQKLPEAETHDADGWDRIQSYAETVRPEELAGLPMADLLTRLFPDEAIRLFTPRPVIYHCPEDWEKVRGMLQTLGHEECLKMLHEQGEISIHDEICNLRYGFDAAAIEALFAPRTVH
jgi:molecular chaperone Hsp33